MSLIQNIIEMLIKCLAHLSTNTLLLTIIGGITFSVLFYIICNLYSRLWNIRYRTTTVHKLLSLFASLFSFIFFIVFIALSQLSAVAEIEISNWSNNLINDSNWIHYTFKNAYENVKKSGLENFENVDPNIIPLTKNESKEITATTSSKDACANFNSRYPFLSQIVGAKSEIPSTIVQEDMRIFFSNPETHIYPTERAVKLVAENIKNDLILQVPKVVNKSRILLILLFVIVQIFPLGLIGFAAYKDLKVKT